MSSTDYNSNLYNISGIYIGESSDIKLDNILANNIGNGPSSIVYYKMQGYYTIGSVYEIWVSEDPNLSPPSGHSLINISVIESWRE